MTNGSSPKLYIAGMGMVTPVGGNVAMTAAAVNAGISAYRSSSFKTKAGKRITMARIPDQVFADFLGEIEEGKRFNPRHDRVVKMAIIALREVFRELPVDEAIPLVLAMPDIKTDADGLSSFIQNLANNIKPRIDPAMSRSIHSGRASGIEAIEFAFKYLYDQKYPYVLLGGSDCHEDFARLSPLDEHGRLLTTQAPDAFAPGEAASFLLLTPYVELAKKHKGNAIALHAPGIADEKGHLFSADPYRGDGLDQAFKKALTNQPERSVNKIYSSMNGENHWAKEYGVAYLRSKKKFTDNVKTEHPADCYGDLGSASATSLIILAIQDLFKNSKAQSHLVYSSSDGAKRGAVVVEKFNTVTERD